MTTIEVPPGLRGVAVTDTTIGDVRGAEGYYHYRQYSAVELARTRTFEQVWFLVQEGRLPTPAEHAAFLAEIAPWRRLPDELHDVLPVLARAGSRLHALDGVRAALALLAASDDLAPLWGSDPAQRRRDALRLCAAVPTILAALHRLRTGREPAVPREDLHGAANWLHLLHGEAPEPELAAALEPYLVATIDHGFNASTFTARVVASTGADLASVVGAAVGAFVGPLHGGAPDRALDALDAIGTPDRVDEHVRTTLLAGDRVMGFGHAVYRTRDPRAEMLREVAEGLRDRPGGALVDLAVATEERVETLLAELKPGQELHANVEFYAGVVMELCGVPRSMFTPTFAVSRVVGWCAHALEQAAEGRLIRPAARYVGPEPQPARSGPDAA